MGAIIKNDSSPVRSMWVKVEARVANANSNKSQSRKKRSAVIPTFVVFFIFLAENNAGNKTIADTTNGKLTLMSIFIPAKPFNGMSYAGVAAISSAYIAGFTGSARENAKTSIAEIPANNKKSLTTNAATVMESQRISQFPYRFDPMAFLYGFAKKKSTISDTAKTTANALKFELMVFFEWLPISAQPLHGTRHNQGWQVKLAWTFRLA